MECHHTYSGDLHVIEEISGVPDAEPMVDILTTGYEQVVKRNRSMLKLATEAGENY